VIGIRDLGSEAQSPWLARHSSLEEAYHIATAVAAVALEWYVVAKPEYLGADQPMMTPALGLMLGLECEG